MSAISDAYGKKHIIQKTVLTCVDPTLLKPVTFSVAGRTTGPTDAEILSAVARNGVEDAEFSVSLADKNKKRKGKQTLAGFKREEEVSAVADLLGMSDDDASAALEGAEGAEGAFEEGK
jgi:hypothetical protein